MQHLQYFGRLQLYIQVSIVADGPLGLWFSFHFTKIFNYLTFVLHVSKPLFAHAKNKKRITALMIVAVVIRYGFATERCTEQKFSELGMKQ